MDDFVRKRDEDQEDKTFEESNSLEFISDDKLSKYYSDIKKQLNSLFIINVIFCSLSMIAILIGVVLIIFRQEYLVGPIATISGVISEVLGNLFIKQYQDTFKRVSAEYFKLLLCNNMNNAFNVAKKLPLVDMADKELRYLEIREILRAIMKNFDTHLAAGK